MRELKGYAKKRKLGLVPIIGQRVALPLDISDEEQALHQREAIIRRRENSPWPGPIMAKRYRQELRNGERRLVLPTQDWYNPLTRGGGR